MAPLEKGVSVIRPVGPDFTDLRAVSFAFTEAVDYRAYILLLTSSLYDLHVEGRTGNWKNSLHVAMKSRNFNASDLATMLTFLQTFKRECDIIPSHESAAVLLLPSYPREPTSTTFQSRINFQGSKDPRSLRTYCQVINQLMGTYASDDIVSIAESDVTRCAQTYHMAESELEALLCKKALRCGSVFSVDKLKCIYSEGLKTRIRHNVRNHWAGHSDVELPAITRYATSVTRITGKRN